jgi:hypothetical protein
MMRPSKRARISSPAEIQRSVIPVGIATRSTTLRLQLEHVVNSWLRPSTCSDVLAYAATLSSLSAPRMTICRALSGSGRCSAFASSHGARIQTSRSSSMPVDHRGPRRKAVGDPDRTKRCPVSVYDPSHSAVQIVIRSMSPNWHKPAVPVGNLIRLAREAESRNASAL